MQRRKRQRKLLLIGGIILGVLLVAGGIALVVARRAEAPAPVETANHTEEKKEAPQEPEKVVESISVQPIIDQFVASSSVDYGIEVYDVAAGKVIGAHQPDKQYFPASTYKLYVAFLSLQRMQTGEFTDTPNFVGERSRMGCIYYTIEVSDSPCGEALMRDITQEKMGQELEALGQTNSPFPGFLTTAHDANVILRHIAEGKHLNKENTDYLLKAMNTQIYNKGLTAGFDQAKVYDKIGFNLDINYHDVAIVEFPTGRKFLVSVYTQGQGSPAPQRKLAQLLQPELAKLQ